MIPTHHVVNRLFRPVLVAAFVSAVVAIAVVGCGDDDPKPATPGKPGAPGAAASKGGGSDTGQVAPAQGEPVPAQASFSLKLQPRVGDQYVYRLTQKGTNEIEGHRATEEATYWFTQKVTGVNNDGSFTVEMRYDSIVSKKSFPAGVVDSVARTFAYDTRRKLDSTVPDAAQAKALIGQRVILTLSKNGEVKEVSNLEPILTAMLGKMRDSLKPQVVEQLREGIKVSVFEVIVQQIFLQSPPDSMVHVGSSWSRMDSVPMVTTIATVPSRAHVSYTLGDARTADARTLGHVTMTLSTEFPRKKMDNAQVTTTINDARASGSGEAILDLATGFPVQKHTRIEMLLKVTGKAKVGPATGQTKTLTQARATTTAVDLVAYVPAPK